MDRRTLTRQDTLSGEFAHYALKLEGGTVGIALNIGDEVETQWGEALLDRTN